MSQTRATRTNAPSIAGRLPRIGQVPFCAVILLCFLPLICLHFRQMWLYEHYQYFPLLLIAFPFVIVQNRDAEPFPRGGDDRLQKLLIVAGLAVLTLAVISWSPNLAAVAMVLTAGGILLHFYQTGHLTRFFSLWFVLFFLIKIPLNVDVDLIFWLQGLTSQMASQLLDFLRVNHYLAGHNIRIANVDFAVEEACSGIQSLFSLLAMTAIILALFRRTLVHSVLLMAAAVFWACIINVIRVTAVVVAFEKLNIDLTQERPHEILGMVLFALAIGLMVSTDRLLLFFTADDTADGDEVEIEHFKTLSASRAGGNQNTATPKADSTFERDNQVSAANTTSLNRLQLTFVGLFLLLAVLQLTILILTSRGLQSIDPDDPRLQNAFAENTLAATMQDWHRKDFRMESRSLTNYQGRNSAQWVYESDSGEVVIGVDYPFLGWHELTGCYIAEGCKLDQREIIASNNAVRATITAPSGATGLLIFSEFMTDGQPLAPLGNDAGTLAYWRSRLQSAMIRQFASFQGDVGSFQVQMLYYYDGELDHSTETKLLELHRLTTERIVAAVKEAMNER